MENVTGLNVLPKIWIITLVIVVEERSYQRRSSTGKLGGAVGSENAGMSNHKIGEKPIGRKSKVS